VGVPEEPAAGNAARYLTRPHIAALKRSGSVSGQRAATALLPILVRDYSVPIIESRKSNIASN